MKNKFCIGIGLLLLCLQQVQAQGFLHTSGQHIANDSNFYLT